MGRWTNLTALALGAVLAVFGHLPSTYELSAAEAPSLRGVYNALGGTMSPAWVAQDLGLFTKHGLQHSLNYLAATTAVQAIVGGTEESGGGGLEVGAGAERLVAGARQHRHELLVVVAEIAPGATCPGHCS